MVDETTSPEPLQGDDLAAVERLRDAFTRLKNEMGKVIDNNPTPGFVANLKEPLSMIPIDGFQQWNAKEKRYVPHGPFHWTVKNGGIEYLSGGSNYRRPNLRSPFFAEDWGRKGVTRDGWYRFRINAGAFRGEGAEAQKEVRLVVESSAEETGTRLIIPQGMVGQAGAPRPRGTGMRLPTVLAGVALAAWWAWKVPRADPEIDELTGYPAIFLGAFGMAAAYWLTRSMHASEPVAGVTSVTRPARTRCTMRMVSTWPSLK